MTRLTAATDTPSQSSTSKASPGETREQHTKRMQRWAEEDKAALAAGKLQPLAERARLITKTVRPEDQPMFDAALSVLAEIEPAPPADSKSGELKSGK